MFILLVEDDHFYASMIGELLQQNGYSDLKHIDNGLECLQQIYEDKVPDVVIMDYHLGMVNGVEILEKIRAYKPDLKVVFMSGQQDVKVAVQSIKKGALDYIIKDENAMQRLLDALQKIERINREKAGQKPVKKLFSRIRDFLMNTD